MERFMKNAKAKKDSKILVALSGGVDSSVAAALLKRTGYTVEAAYMRCWSRGPYCSADQDEADAARVAARLAIQFRVFNFEKEYKRSVINYFFSEYKKGRTPNPDVICNKEIKFGLFQRKAAQLGFDYIATGHYARITNGVDYRLLCGKDKSKDQSYFLYLVGQKQLAHALFPLGDLTKKEVRKLAKKFALPTANKPDSTGICFVGPADVREFLAQKIKKTHGDIVSVKGEVLGKHIGLSFYTIGQREGIGISASVPYYVASKDLMNNKLIVAPFGHDSLFRSKFTTEAPHWVEGKQPKLPKKVSVKLRHRAKNVAGKVKSTHKDKLEVTLDTAQRAITPGQSAVFHSGNQVLGGAVIDRVIN
jgi:tRNA-specific 2-thiouridylase